MSCPQHGFLRIWLQAKARQQAGSTQQEWFEYIPGGSVFSAKAAAPENPQAAALKFFLEPPMNPPSAC
jgi:hypothetical protein